MNKKRILITGFYGARNTGDELMLRSILDSLNLGKYQVTILVAKNKELDVKKEYTPFNVEYYPENQEELKKLAAKFNVIIWGGGAMIDDEDYKTEPCLGLSYIMIELTLLVLKNNGQALVLGVSTNKELKKDVFIKKIQYIIDHATVFTLRDKNSLKTLKASNIKISKVVLCDDLVVSSLKIQKIKNKRSFYSLGLAYIYNEKTVDYLYNFSSILIDCILSFQTKDIQIKLIPFYDYNNNDMRYCNILKDRLLLKYPDLNITILSVIPATMNLIYSAFSGCDLIVGMRYHALLISSLLGYKTISLDYSDSHRHYKNKISDINSHYGRHFLSINFNKNLDIATIKKITYYVKNVKKQKHISKKYLKNSKKQLKKFLEKID